MDSDLNVPSRLPEKRLARDKKPVLYEEPELRNKQNEGFRQVAAILSAIKRHPVSSPFMDLSDFYLPSEDRVDLVTIEHKLNEGEYDNSYQFAADMRKIWNNSFKMNADGSDIYHMTLELSALFERLIKGKENIVINDKKDAITDLSKKLEKMSKELKELSSGRAVAPTTSKLPVKLSQDRPMSLQEKRVLGQNIRKLEPQYLIGVINIVKECMDVGGEEFEFDLDKLPPKICRDLERYVKQSLQTSSKSQKKKKPAAVNYNGIVSAKEASAKRLKELDNELEEIAKKTRVEPAIYQPPPEIKESESESESSSSSESEDEDLPSAPITSSGPTTHSDPFHGGFSVSNMWSRFQETRLQPSDQADFTARVDGTMMDLMKHDIFH